MPALPGQTVGHQGKQLPLAAVVGFGESPRVGRAVSVDDESEVEAAAVAEDDRAEAESLDQSSDGVECLDAGAGEVHLRRWPGDVGDDRVGCRALKTSEQRRGTCGP